MGRGRRKRRGGVERSAYRVGYADGWHEDMHWLRGFHRPARQEADRIVLAIKSDPYQVGYLLMHGRWQGSRAEDFGSRNQFRLIWDVSEQDPKRIIFRTVGERQDVYEQEKPLERGE